MKRFIRNTGYYLIIFLVTIGIYNYISNTGESSTPLRFDELITAIESDNVEELILKYEDQSYLVTGKYRTAPDDGSSQSFTSRASVASLEQFEELRQQYGFTMEFEKMKTAGFWTNFLITIIPFVLIIILFFFLMNQAQGGGGKVMNFGKSRAKLYNEEKKRVTFQDVAGADEEKQELVEVVDFLKDPRKFNMVGARIPKGVLLVGPPGTGKTLLARAVAGEAGVPFFSISGSDFVEMFVGVGASRVRDLFENAKKNAPCIIFIDEIDAVGRQRGAGLGGGHDEREQTLNQMLVEMDGFGANEGIIIIAATNRADILDPALLRPGRFDRQITVDRPDVKGREAVLKVHARNKPLTKEVQLDIIAKRTTGFSGADLENLLNEAALLAARRNKKEINMVDIDDAIDRVIVGTEKKSRVISDREKRIVAYHEAGHTIAGYFLEHADQVHKVTIIPRGRAGGYVIMLPKEDRMLVTKNELLDRVCGLLAGRVAEELFIGEIGTGAYSDFKQATGIVRSMIMEYGMSDRLGPMQFGSSQGQVFLGRDIGNEQNYSDQIAYEIDQEMQSIINSCYDRTKQLLQEKSEEMHLLATTLLEVETLEIEQIKSLLTTGELPEAFSVGANNGSDDDSNSGSDNSPTTVADGSNTGTDSSSDETADAENTTSEPIIDEIGDVKVRIQKREQDEPSSEQGIVEENPAQKDDKKE